MMYDFHYPLGQAKLNEDTANCHAKQCGMEVGEARTAVPWLTLFAPPVLPYWEWELKTTVSLKVHSQSINQELLKVETILSHQYGNSWATTSIPTLIYASFTVSLTTFPGMVGMKKKAGTIMRSILNFRKLSGRDHKFTGYEKCF